MTASIIRKAKGLNKKTPLILFLTVLLIIVPLAGLACGGDDEEPVNVEYDKVTLTISTGFSSAEINGKTATKLAEVLEERSGGSIKGVVFTDGALFTYAEDLDSVKTGAVDITVSHPRFLIRPVDPSLDIFGGASRMIVNLAHGKAIMEDGRLPLKVAEGFDGIGLHFMGYVNTFIMSGMFNTVRETPAYHPDYMKGLKLTVTSAGALEPLDQYCQLVGVPVPSTERTLALSQGIAEASPSPLDQAVALGWHKIAKHLVATTVYSPIMIVMNGNKWDSLSPQTQALIQDVVMPEVQQWAANSAVESTKKTMKILVQSMDTIHFEVPADSYALWLKLLENPAQQKRLATYPKSTLDIIDELRPKDNLKIDPETIEILQYAGIPVPPEAGRPDFYK